MSYLVREFDKIWHGLASIRDTELERGIKSGGMVFVYKGKTMTKDASELRRHKFQCHAKEFRSKFNNSVYKLYDFKFTPDEERVKVQEDNQLKLL